jgi:hypothetical protein
MTRGDIIVLLAGEPAPSELPREGDPLVVEIDLPANHAFGRKCMQCQTTVVRVSRSHIGVASVAMRIHKIRFQSCVEASASDQGSAVPFEQLLM